MIFQSFFFGWDKWTSTTSSNQLDRQDGEQLTNKERLKVLSSAKELLDGDEELGSWDPGMGDEPFNLWGFTDIYGKKVWQTMGFGMLVFFPEKKSRQPAGRSTNLGDDCSSNPSYVLAIWVNSESLGAIWILLVGIETYWSNRYRFQGSRWRGPLSSGTQGAWDVGCRVVPERIVRCRLGTKTRPSVIPWFDASLWVAAVVELAPMSIPPF